MRNPLFLTIALLAAFLAPQLGAAELHLNATVAVPDVPHVLTGELDLQLGSKWAIGVSGGGINYTYNSSSGPIPLSMAAGTFKLRYHPFSGAYFIGLAAGYQMASAGESGTFTITDPNNGQTVNVATSVKLTINSPYVTPHTGWLWVTKRGFTWGFEFGAQIPKNSTSNLDIQLANPQYNQYLAQVKATQPYQTLQTDIQNIGDKLGNIVLPYAAIRIGWTF